MKFQQGEAAVLKPMARRQRSSHPFESLALLSWQIDADGDGRSFNAAYRHFSGADEDTLLGGGWRHGLHPADSNTWPQIWSVATCVDVRLRRADGAYRWMRVSTIALEPTLATLCALDVTDLIEAHERATEDLALQRQLFDQIPAFIVVKDADNNLLRSNRCADRYFGGSPETMEGRNCYDLFPHDIARTWHNQDRAVIDSGEPLLGVVEELELHGRKQYHRMDKVPFKYTSDGATLVLVLGVEISDAKMLERRLREQIEDSEALVRVLRQREYEQNLILDNIPVAILYKDTDNRILRANRFAADLIGTTQADIEGRHANMALPNEAAALYLHDLDVLRSRQPHTNIIETITTRRGEQRWLRLHHLPCFDATGALTRIMVVGEDITVARNFEAQLQERAVQAEILLAELEKRGYEQQVIFDHIPARIVYKDTNNRVIRANRFAAELIGLTLDQFEGHNLSEIFGEDAEKYYADDLEVIRTRRPLSNILERLKGRGGETRWVRTEKVPLLNNDGEVTGIIVLSVDATADKLAEDEIRRQRAELQLILDHSPAAIAFRDAEGKVLRVNRTCCLRMNMTEQQLVGRNLLELFGEAAKPWIAEGREVMRSGKPLRRSDVEYAHLGNNSIWQTDTVPIHDEQGRAVGVVVMAHDITEQKLFEDELRRQKEESSKILDNIPSMIFVKDGNDTLMSVNRAAAEQFGRRAEDLIGKSSGDVFPDPDGRFWQEDLNIMRSRKPRYGMKCEFVREGAPSLWWRYHKVPYFDGAGQAVGVIAIGDDITADMAAQHALEDALAQARHHEHELRTLFDNLPICVIFKDTTNRILRANRFAAEFFRESADSLVGRDIGELVLEGELGYRESDREVLETGMTKFDNLHVLPLVDGRRVVVRSHKVRYHDADGKVLGLLIAFQETGASATQNVAASCA